MLRLSRLLIAAALAFPCLAAYGQEGEPQFKCASVIEFMAVLRELQDIPGAKIEQLEGPEAVAFLALFNEQEPVTDYKADIIVFVTGPEVGTITFVSGDRACLLRQQLPAGAIRGILEETRRRAGQPV